KTEIEMVYVPPGEFVTGADEGTRAEKPQRKETIARGFFIARTETTWAQFDAFCEATGRASPARPAWVTRGDQPVEGLSFEDVNAFCAWAGLRLPTDAEWEKAARGTDGRVFPWGNTWQPLHANFCDRSYSYEKFQENRDDSED